MIEKRNLLKLLGDLDAALEARGERLHRELVIYGGAALIALNIPDRATVDIDVFEPTLDLVLISTIKELAQKNMFDEHWINSTGLAFKHEMPKGWKQRTVIVFKGRFLSVKMLGRIDLIFTKILAELDRGEDLQDLIKLKPTQSEINSLRPHLCKLESGLAWQTKIEDLLQLLTRKVQ